MRRTVTALIAVVVFVQIMYWAVALYCPVKVLLKFKTKHCTQALIVLGK